jgi:hypothetical protein
VKSLGKMVLTDKIIIRHSVKHLPEGKPVSEKTGINDIARALLVEGRSIKTLLARIIGDDAL